MSLFRKPLFWVVLALIVVVVVVAVVALSGGSDQESAETESQTAAEEEQATTEEQAATYDDPFAYCAAVGTVDAPDERYTGEPVPETVVKALQAAMEGAENAPEEWTAEGTVWRCMDGQVWGCFVGANIPCTAKLDTEKTPSAEMEAYCQENPDAETIPASVTGRETAYSWSCKNGKPEAGEQVFEADAQGFIAEFWYQLSAPAENG